MHRNQSTSSDPVRAEASAEPNSPGAEQSADTASIDPAARYILLSEAEKAKLSFDSYLRTNGIDLINLAPSLRAFGTRALRYPRMPDFPASPSPGRLAAIQWHNLPESTRGSFSMAWFAQEHHTSLSNMSQFVSESGELCGEWPDSARAVFSSLAAPSRGRGMALPETGAPAPEEQLPLQPRR